MPSLNPSTESLVTIGDTVWLDYNADGVQDENEPGLEGITVILVDLYGTPIDGQVQVTDSEGHYRFEHLPPGVYGVKYEVPPEYSFSPSNPMSDTIDKSDPNAGDYAADINGSGMAAPVELAPGSTDLSFDAGLILPVTISGTIFIDHNANGIRDPEETGGIEGATIMLFNVATQSYEGEAVTDLNGFYTFSAQPGNYYVKLLSPSTNYIVSPVVEGGNAFDQAYETAPVMLYSGDNAVFDGGLYMLASVGNRVWFDSQPNGIQDVGEGPMNETISVKLYDSLGILKGETETSAEGFYQFTGLTPGTYEVQFQLPPAGFTFTLYKAGDNGAVDNDVSPVTGRAKVTLQSGEHNDDIDAGIGSLAWSDLGPYYPDWRDDVQGKKSFRR